MYVSTCGGDCVMAHVSLLLDVFKDDGIWSYAIESFFYSVCRKQRILRSWRRKQTLRHQSEQIIRKKTTEDNRNSWTFRVGKKPRF